MNASFSRYQRWAVFLTLYALVMPIFATGTDGKSDKKLTDDQKIIHVLNRLGFVAPPGELEKGRASGLQKYIDQQLDPASINDSVAEAKVKNLEVFNMSTAEVFAKYPNPGALLRQLEGGRRAQAAQRPGDVAKSDAAKSDAGKMPAEPAQPTEEEQRERRQKLEALYKEYDLRPANQIVPQIAANRILRAAYSERQLQEV